ncbi:MAG: LicD family protein, partial [Clostridia bacterium]|nr:LicD family protein [Clostridia bacterium]
METHSYTEKELKQIQLISLEMATEFWDFCKHNNLTAYLCGGGCIGAIRHKGFIPWDDDLDFFMPRDDYEFFIAHWNECESSKDLALVLSNESVVDHNLFATLRNKNTTMIRENQADADIVHGVALDIIPLDGFPNSKLQRKIQVVNALIYSLFCAQVIPEKHGGIMALGSRILLGVFKNKKTRYKIWKNAEQKMTKHKIYDCRGITELCTGPKYMRNWYDKKWFETYIEMPFEDKLLPIPIGYDKYLKT